jgi:hypothetical protein
VSSYGYFWKGAVQPAASGAVNSGATSVRPPPAFASTSAT